MWGHTVPLDQLHKQPRFSTRTYELASRTDKRIMRGDRSSQGSPLVCEAAAGAEPLLLQKWWTPVLRSRCQPMAWWPQCRNFVVAGPDSGARVAGSWREFRGPKRCRSSLLFGLLKQNLSYYLQYTMNLNLYYDDLGVRTFGRAGAQAFQRFQNQTGREQKLSDEDKDEEEARRETPMAKRCWTRSDEVVSW